MEVVGQWWRVVSESTFGSFLTREDPEYYLYDNSHLKTEIHEAICTLSDPLPEIRNTVFFTSMTDSIRPSILTILPS